MSTVSSTPALVDTHCHLAALDFDADRSEVLAAARALGVRRFVTIGTTLEDSQAGLRLARAHTAVYAAVGIHPNHSHLQPGDYLRRLEETARDPKVVALGEIGLDYHWDRAPRAQQHKVLREQLALAARLGLPVAIHCREAMPDVLRCLAEWMHSSAYIDTPLAARPYAGILHAFSGNAAEARQAREMNFLLGLGGPVTFKNARALHALVPHLGLAGLVLETDAPYLCPHPYRGQRNEPKHIPLICNRIAELMGISAAAVAERTTANTHSLFGWSPG